MSIASESALGNVGAELYKLPQVHPRSGTRQLSGVLAEESARREHKHLAAWARERLRIAAMVTVANGYSPGWLKLFASIEDDTFASLSRIDTRPVSVLELE